MVRKKLMMSDDFDDADFYGERQKDWHEFSVFPSRNKHKLRTKDRPQVELEVVAWLLVLNKRTGKTFTKPVTQFGSIDWSDVHSYIAPTANLKGGQAIW